MTVPIYIEKIIETLVARKIREYIQGLNPVKPESTKQFLDGIIEAVVDEKNIKQEIIKQALLFLQVDATELANEQALEKQIHNLTIDELSTFEKVLDLRRQIEVQKTFIKAQSENKLEFQARLNDLNKQLTSVEKKAEALQNELKKLNKSQQVQNQCADLRESQSRRFRTTLNKDLDNIETAELIKLARLASAKLVDKKLPKDSLETEKQGLNLTAAKQKLNECLDDYNKCSNDITDLSKRIEHRQAQTSRLASGGLSSITILLPPIMLILAVIPFGIGFPPLFLIIPAIITSVILLSIGVGALFNFIKNKSDEKSLVGHTSRKNSLENEKNNAIRDIIILEQRVLLSEPQNTQLDNKLIIIEKSLTQGELNSQNTLRNSDSSNESSSSMTLENSSSEEIQKLRFFSSSSDNSLSSIKQDPTIQLKNP